MKTEAFTPSDQAHSNNCLGGIPQPKILECVVLKFASLSFELSFICEFEELKDLHVVGLYGYVF